MKITSKVAKWGFCEASQGQFPAFSSILGRMTSFDIRGSLVVLDCKNPSPKAVLGSKLIQKKNLDPQPPSPRKKHVPERKFCRKHTSCDGIEPNVLTEEFLLIVDMGPRPWRTQIGPSAQTRIRTVPDRQSESGLFRGHPVPRAWFHPDCAFCVEFRLHDAHHRRNGSPLSKNTGKTKDSQTLI